MANPVPIMNSSNSSKPGTLPNMAADAIKTTIPTNPAATVRKRRGLGAGKDEREGGRGEKEKRRVAREDKRKQVERMWARTDQKRKEERRKRKADREDERRKEERQWERETRMAKIAEGRRKEERKEKRRAEKAMTGPFRAFAL
ncbi:hypothetical protein BGX38DRAFT_1144586 [Terfezia claveryi]|nr:hypothetical protein BGX38DRAFT_1144586 [Terfezia claveryi]